MKYARKPDYKKLLIKLLDNICDLSIPNHNSQFICLSICPLTLQETFGAFRGVAFEKAIKQAKLKKYALNAIFSEVAKILDGEDSEIFPEFEGAEILEHTIQIYPHPTKAGEFANIVTVKTEIR